MGGKTPDFQTHPNDNCIDLCNLSCIYWCFLTDFLSVPVQRRCDDILLEDRNASWHVIIIPASCHQKTRSPNASIAKPRSSGLLRSEKCALPWRLKNGNTSDRITRSTWNPLDDSKSWHGKIYVQMGCFSPNIWRLTCLFGVPGVKILKRKTRRANCSRRCSLGSIHFPPIESNRVTCAVLKTRVKRMILQFNRAGRCGLSLL